MRIPDLSQKHNRFSKLALIFAVLTLSACADVSDSGGTYDPAEPVNRAVHSFNKGVDTIALRPISKVYGAVLPEPVENSVARFGANLGDPANAVNHLLQGDLAASANNVGRFGVNTTIGLLGLFDPATSIGMLPDDTDFGETLHTWGAKEGAYLSLPLLGPSTVRDATGTIVEIMMDPVNVFVKAPESDYVVGGQVLAIVDARHRYAVGVDAGLYGSVDSYTTTRNAYLQNRRNTLKGQTDEDDLEDPFDFE